MIWKKLPPLPNARGVAGGFAGISDRALLVAGGANFPEAMPWEGGKKAWHDEIWRLEAPNASWQSVGTLPRPLAYGVSATWRGSVICAGGSNSERHFADVFRLIWKGAKLLTESLPALPATSSGASGALVGDLLYVAAGAERPGEQAASNRAFALDLALPHPRWRELPPIPGKPRILATSAAHDGAFYLFGGAALEPGSDGKVARIYLRDAWRFRPEQGWKRLADLTKPVAAAPSPAAVLDGKILLIGGDDGSRVGFAPLNRHPGFPSTILAYDPSLDRWRELGQTPAPRATAPIVAWRGMFAIPSGEVRPGVRSPEIWSFARK